MSDIDTAAADSLKALDLEWPIREAEVKLVYWHPIQRAFRTYALGSETLAGHLSTPARLPVTLPPGPARLSRPAATGSPAPAITTDLGAEDDCEWSFAENDKLCNKLNLAPQKNPTVRIHTRYNWCWGGHVIASPNEHSSAQNA